MLDANEPNIAGAYQTAYERDIVNYPEWVLFSLTESICIRTGSKNRFFPSTFSYNDPKNMRELIANMAEIALTRRHNVGSVLKNQKTRSEAWFRTYGHKLQYVSLLICAQANGDD